MGRLESPQIYTLRAALLLLPLFCGGESTNDAGVVVVYAILLLQFVLL